MMIKPEVQDDDSVTLFHELGRAWRDIQTVLFCAALTDDNRRCIEEGLRRIEAVRAKLDKRGDDAQPGNRVAELSTVIHSELHRAGLDELDPAWLVAALRLLANDIERGYLQ